VTETCGQNTASVLSIFFLLLLLLMTAACISTWSVSDACPLPVGSLQGQAFAQLGLRQLLAAVRIGWG